MVTLTSAGLYAFYLCSHLAVKSLHSTFVPGLLVTVFSCSCLGFFVVFFFPSLDLQIHQVQ